MTMAIVSKKQEPMERICLLPATLMAGFWNYFQHGIDFLISGSGRIKRIIMHTNIVCLVRSMTPLLGIIVPRCVFPARRCANADSPAHHSSNDTHAVPGQSGLLSVSWTPRARHPMSQAHYRLAWTRHHHTSLLHCRLARPSPRSRSSRAQERSIFLSVVAKIRRRPKLLETSVEVSPVRPCHRHPSISMSMPRCAS